MEDVASENEGPKAAGASGGGERASKVEAGRARIAQLVNGHASGGGGKARRSRRMTSEERFEQIVDVAVRLIGEKGYYGMSLQDVANEIGVSQTAVIHRVKSKQGLLIAVIERHYDKFDAVDRYLSLFEPGGAREGGRPRVPEALRRVVEQNSRQPEMVKVFEMLNTEAMSPVHPAYAYFAERPERMARQFREHEWAVPDGVDAEFVYMLANAAMYGLEGRWLANPERIDFVAEWDRYADYLFPSPLWDDYR